MGLRLRVNLVFVIAVLVCVFAAHPCPRKVRKAKTATNTAKCLKLSARKRLTR